MKTVAYLWRRTSTGASRIVLHDKVDEDWEVAGELVFKDEALDLLAAVERAKNNAILLALQNIGSNGMEKADMRNYMESRKENS